MPLQTEIRMNSGREVVLLTLAQAAERLSVSTKTLRRIIERGDLPVVRLGPDGKSDRVEKGDLDNYI
jgi:excisionase family DNA binding protein